MNILPSRKLKVDIFAAFALLLGVTIVGEVYYSFFANKKLILNFEKNYYSKTISKTTTKWLDEYFAKLEVIAQVFSKGFSGERSAFDKYDVLFLETLKNIPYTLSIYLSFKDGTYYQVRTLEGLKEFQLEKSKSLPTYGKYAIRTMQHDNEEDPEALSETWKYLNEDYGVVAKEHLPQATYNTTKRDWYITAELAKGKVWTDVYVLKTTKLPGITLSIPLGYYNGSDTAIGVFGIDFAVNQFNDLLAEVQSSPNSVNYLINEKSEVIAASNKMKTYRVGQDSGEMELVTTMNSGNKVLQRAAKLLTGNKERYTRFSFDGKEYIASIAKLKRIPCSLITIFPEEDFTAEFQKVQFEMLLLSLFVFIVAFAVVLILAHRISDPIVYICNAAKAIGSLDVENYKPFPPTKIIEIQELSDVMESMKASVSTFTKYAPKDLVRRLVKKGTVPAIGGENRKLTLFFSDIEKFSTIAEKLPAEYLVLHLSEYLDEMTKQIMDHEGIIDKYIGDGIMAMWGAPIPDENQAVNACYAAIACQKVLLELKDKWALVGKPPLPTRIGIHTGIAIVGNVGSTDRMNFTSIGDAVNIASRLEGANKNYGTNILVSENVEMEARGKLLFRVIDKIAVKGRVGGIIVYEPLVAMNATSDETYYKLLELSSKSNEAFECYQNQDFEKALDKYKTILRLFPEVEPSITPLMARCRELKKTPPVDWDGTYVLKEK